MPGLLLRLGLGFSPGLEVRLGLRYGLELGRVFGRGFRWRLTPRFLPGLGRSFLRNLDPSLSGNLEVRPGSASGILLDARLDSA